MEDSIFFQETLGESKPSDFSPEQLEQLRKYVNASELWGALKGSSFRTATAPFSGTADVLNKLTSNPVYLAASIASMGILPALTLGIDVASAPLKGAMEGAQTTCIKRYLADRFFADDDLDEDAFDEDDFDYDGANLSKPSVKKASSIGLGGPLARTMSELGKNTVGGGSLAYFPGALEDPYSKEVSGLIGGLSDKDDKAKIYRHILAKMEEANPDELSDVRVNLGGTALGRDIVRILTNKRLGVLGLPLGLLSIPGRVLGSTIRNVERADHYDPLTNTVNLYSDDPAIFTHELGHALDYNSRSPEALTKPSPRAMYNLPGKLLDYLTSRVSNTKRDFYSMGYGFDPLRYEKGANEASRKALTKALSDDKEAMKLLNALRQKSLPRGYRTYQNFYSPKEDLTYSLKKIISQSGTGGAMDEKYLDQGQYTLLSKLREHIKNKNKDNDK